MLVKLIVYLWKRLVEVFAEDFQVKIPISKLKYPTNKIFPSEKKKEKKN